MRGDRSKITGWSSWADHRADEKLVVELPRGGDIPCALFFPADYSVGMSNLGLHYIYRKLCECGVMVERFFDSPIRYRSVERDTMLERFEIILASVSYEADVIKLVEWLRGAGIDPSRRTRSDRGGPMIGVGGAITYIAPILLSGVADIIMLGDGIDLIEKFCCVMTQNVSFDKKINALASDPYFLIPSVHLDEKREVEPRIVHKKQDIDLEYGSSTWITNRTVFGSTLLVELQRGCIGGCRYCTLPSCFRPFRQRALDRIKKLIACASERVDFSQVGLITPEASDYHDLGELLTYITRDGKGVSFASLRVDGLTEDAARCITEGGRRSITIAPEAGGDELRSKCGKRFTNDLIIDKLMMVSSLGVNNVKMYYMIGLPDETDDDVDSIRELCWKVRQETGMRVTAAVSPFVPKPGTAWSTKNFAGESDLKRKIKRLTSSFNGSKGLSLQCSSPREAALEYSLTWCSSSDADLIAQGEKSIVRKDISRERTRDEYERLGLI